MEETKNVYTRLQEHLDKQAVGFPATESGVELRILEELFTPEQAGLALHLSWRPKTLEEIAADTGDEYASLEEIEAMLGAMAENGAIGVAETDGVDTYYLMPFLIGIVELHSSKASPRFFVNYTKYFREGYGKAFIETKVSQMRTIPVEKSITAENIVSTYDHVRDIIRDSPGPFAISPCICREGAKARGNPCEVTSRTDTCMSLGDWARNSIRNGTRELTREEALEILAKNQEEGLVLQPTNYQNPDFICSCCGDCCGVLSIQKSLPNPAENWAHNFYAVVDAESCTGCGLCIERCQMDAPVIDEQAGYAAIQINRCFGCGNCVTVCPSEAIRLVKVENEVEPPADRIGLYEILVNKKG